MATVIGARIGQRIRATRQRRDLTQATLGKKLEISFQLVQAYERERAKPSHARLATIADVLDVDADWLLTGGQLERRLTGERRGEHRSGRARP